MWIVFAWLFAYATIRGLQAWRHYRDVLILLLALAALSMGVNSLLHACIRMPSSICKHSELVGYGRILVGTVGVLMAAAVDEYVMSRAGAESLLDRLRKPAERVFGRVQHE